MLRRPWLLALAALTLAVLAAVAALAHLRFYAAHSRLPDRGATVVPVNGCALPVEIRLDDRGIPHVTAAGENDLWYALGYLHARERFFQMEMARRLAAGRLAEVFGEAALVSDRRMRTLRMAATAQRQATLLNGDERAVLLSYAAGVNEALAAYGRWIAPEIWLLGYDPEPWQVDDSLAVGVLLELNLSWSMGDEMQRAVELARLGRERAVDLFGWSPEEARAWIPPVHLPETQPEEEEAFTPPMAAGGSNAWAIGPARSATGRPLLANDPHLAVSMPSTWFAVHLQAPGLHVAGLSVPGAPGIVIGHTGGVAWGFTMAMLDDQDIFVLELDESRSRELVDGVWRPLRTVSESIKVRWRDKGEPLRVRISERGPVLRETGREVLALSWTAYFGPSPIRAFLAMARCQSAAELVRCWEGVVGPSLSLVAADSAGHIVHHVVGTPPERGLGAGRLPVPGPDSRWAWRGFQPLAANPHWADPREGFVAAANHDFFTEGDAAMESRVPGDFMSPWRIRRIRAVLGARDSWNVEDCVELQQDLLSGRAVAFLKMLRPDLEAHGGPTADRLAQWDGRMTTSGIAPRLYSELLGGLGEEVGGDEALREGLKHSPVGPEQVLRLLAGGLDEAWWDDVRSSVREGRAEIVARCLDRIDGERDRRSWGEVHQVSFRHPLGAFPLIGALVRQCAWLGPFPAPGDGSTVDAHHWSDRRPYEVTVLPSMRLVCDVGNWDATVLVLPPGQSGRLWSSHLADQVRPWLEGEAPTFPFSQQAVERATRASIVLEPRPRG